MGVSGGDGIQYALKGHQQDPTHPHRKNKKN